MGFSDDPRPCTVDGSHALCHGFFSVEKPNIEDGKQVGRWSNVVALIEFRSGSVEMVKPTDVRFMDGSETFSRFDWGDA